MNQPVEWIDLIFVLILNDLAVIAAALCAIALILKASDK